MLDVLRYTRRLKAKECAHLAATIQIAYFNMFGRILGKQNNHGVYPDFKVEHPFFAVIGLILYLPAACSIGLKNRLSIICPLGSCSAKNTDVRERL